MPTSPRSLRARKAQDLLAVLADGHWHSTWELCRSARLCDPATLVREIRGHGWDVPRECRSDGHHYYRLSTEDLGRLIALEATIARDKAKSMLFTQAQRLSAET